MLLGAWGGGCLAACQDEQGLPESSTFLSFHVFRSVLWVCGNACQIVPADGLTDSVTHPLVLNYGLIQPCPAAEVLKCP